MKQTLVIIGAAHVVAAVRTDELAAVTIEPIAAGGADLLVMFGSRLEGQIGG